MTQGRRTVINSSLPVLVSVKSLFGYPEFTYPRGLTDDAVIRYLVAPGISHPAQSRTRITFAHNNVNPIQAVHSAGRPHAVKICARIVNKVVNIVEVLTSGHG